MVRALSDLTEAELFIGLELVSAQGTAGELAGLGTWTGGDEHGELGVRIIWEDGSESCQPLSCCGAVKVKVEV